MKNLYDWLTTIPVKYPRVMIYTFICITIIFGICIKDLTINTSLRSLIEHEGKDRDYCEEIKEIFGNEEMIIISFSGADLFTHEKLAKLQNLAESLVKHEYVDDIKSIFTSRNVTSSEFGVSVNPVFDTIPADSATIAKYKQILLDNPLFAGNIISRDGKHIAFILNLTTMREEKYIELNVMEKVVSYFQQELEAADLGLEFHLGGFPIMRVYSSRLTQRDFLVMMPIIFVIICTIIYFSFRSFKILFLSMGGLCMNLVWVTGLMSAFGTQISVGTAMVPTLLLIISSSFMIHLISIYSHFHKQNGSGSKSDVIVNSLRYIIISLLFIALTTIAGFSSLSVSHLMTVKQLGKYLASGIFFIFLIATFFIPACLSLMDIEKKSKEKDNKKAIFNSLMKFFYRLSIRKPQYIICFFCVILLLSLYKIPDVEIKQNTLELFKRDSVLRQDAYFINDNFDGANGFMLVIEANETEAFTEPDILNKVDQIQRYMESKKVIVKTQSIVDIIKLLNKSLHNQDPNYYKIPENREAVFQYLLLNSNASSYKDMARLITYDYDKINVFFRFNNYDTKQWLSAQKDIEMYAEKILPENYSARATGSLFLLARGFENIGNTMMSSILLATVLLTVLMVILFRSIPIGIITIIPNIVPIFIALGVISWLGVQLDMITSTFGCIALGIAVDDTIHFTKSFFLELKNNQPTDIALENTFIKAGTPMTITTMAISIGFSIFAFSQFQLLMIFGLLCSMVMLLCLIVDLTLLPVVLRFYAKRSSSFKTNELSYASSANQHIRN